MTYEFGPFRYDAGQRLLFRGGDLVPLVPKALETLHVLLERRGSVVEKSELMKLVWPDTNVEDVGLARNTERACCRRAHRPCHPPHYPARRRRYSHCSFRTRRLPTSGAFRNSRKRVIARKRFSNSTNSFGVATMAASSVVKSRYCLKRSRSAAG
jgi:hypothetical protein